MSFHFGENKTKCIIFGAKLELNNVGKLDIICKGIDIIQHLSVAYLGCIPDDAKAGESINLKILKKIESTLSFLGRYKEFLIPKLQRILCNDLMQTHFDNACFSW